MPKVKVHVKSDDVTSQVSPFLSLPLKAHWLLVCAAISQDANVSVFAFELEGLLFAPMATRTKSSLALHWPTN